MCNAAANKMASIEKLPELNGNQKLIESSPLATEKKYFLLPSSLPPSDQLNSDELNLTEAEIESDYSFIIPAFQPKRTTTKLSLILFKLREWKKWHKQKLQKRKLQIEKKQMRNYGTVSRSHTPSTSPETTSIPTISERNESSGSNSPPNEIDVTNRIENSSCNNELILLAHSARPADPLNLQKGEEEKQQREQIVQQPAISSFTNSPKKCLNAIYVENADNTKQTMPLPTTTNDATTRNATILQPPEITQSNLLDSETNVIEV